MKETSSDPLFQAWKRFNDTGRIEPRVLRREIAESWKRCRFEFGLDPFATPRPVRLSSRQLAQRRQANGTLTVSAQPVLQLLDSAVRGSDFIITLSDRDGYVIEVIGDEEILGMASANNYLPGCRRTEDEVGTNAIGLSLHLRKAVQVTGHEHFNVNHHRWTCSSSPIFSPERDLLGTITLSGRSVGIHQHTLGMVISAAKAIEKEIREGQLSREKDSLNSYLDALLDSISEGILATRKDGLITHINRVAERMLELDKDQVVGQSLRSVIELDPGLWREILRKDHLSDQEMAVNRSGAVKSFLLSTRPVVLGGTVAGKIITLTEKQRVYELIQRFAGSHARFSFDDIRGRDPQLLRQIRLAKIAAKTHSRILLVGESGTGKELFAQAIHNESRRRNNPFVAVSCAAVPRELIEAELFGYREGAFTGARRGGQVGKFELADGGTLFLDEISSMPLEMQAKILRAVQENEVVRLGEDRARKVDVRVIAATNKDLMEEVQNRNFREDLYFRLNVVEIVIPPLRDRKGDIGSLCEHFLRRIAAQLDREEIRISGETFRTLQEYHWPGNVRELENALERASILCEDGVIRPEHLPRLLSSPPRPGPLAPDTAGSLRDHEGQMILQTLKECRGNVSQSARRLGVSRSTLHRRIREMELSPHRFR